MQVIKIENLVKEFQAKQKKQGLSGSIKSLFHPEYKHIKAVDSISFTVKEGDLIGFIGPNGAGKSTTIKIMSGIMYPTSGKVSVLGFEPQQQRKKLAYQIGTVFGQKSQLIYHLPALDTFFLFSKIYEIPKTKYKKRLNYLAKKFEISEFINQPVRKLSLGQRMRCELVASLLHNPRVLFLDEPTIGLDITAKKIIRELIKELNEKEKTTIILTSHDMDDVEKVCNRLIIINHGKIVYDGGIHELRRDYLKFKRISILLEEPAPRLNLNGAKIIKQTKIGIKLEINTEILPVKEAFEILTKKLKIADITISDPPIEEIIEAIYRK